MSAKQRPENEDDKKIILLGEENNKEPLITLNNGEPITLNIGGIKYQTSLTTLLNNDSSFFNKMFNGTYSLKPNNDGSYFIDRDGSYFQYILNYLRDKTFIISSYNKTYILQHLFVESQYYLLSSLSHLIKIEIAKETKELKFDDMKYGNDLQFIDDEHIQLLGLGQGNMGSVCLLQEPISNSMCNEYAVYFRIMYEDITYSFAFGYVTSKNDVDFNQGLGSFSDAIIVTSHDNRFLDITADPLNYTCSGFNRGDIIGLKFNFVTDEMEIYHNDHLAELLPLDGNKIIIPAVALYDRCTSLEIIRHEFK